MEEQRTLFRGLSRSKIALEASLASAWGPVAGVDEVGRGCLAGPVVAAAVILAPDAKVRGVTDSKLLTPKKREALDREIRRRAIAVGVGSVEPAEIDRVNILVAALEAMRIAVAQLAPVPGYLLIDGVFKIPGVELPQQVVVKGDYRCRCIGAASIVAKVWRDRLMAELDAKHPGYGFAEHKGYSCPQHRKALAELGPSPIHRRSFDGVLPPGAEEDEAGQESLDFGESGELRVMTAGRAKKLASLRRGALAEARVLEQLVNEGWTALDQNWRIKGGELDLVVARGETLAFVEVKMLARVEDEASWHPEDHLTPSKRSRLARTAEAWLQSNAHRVKGLFPRFDVATVIGEGMDADVKILEDAFDASGRG